MRVRTQDGVGLHVQVLGPEEGPPVVMLHGLVTGNLATWYFGVAPRLSRSRRVVLFDFRGHGRSDRAATGYGVRAMAGDLECVIDAVHGGPVDLVGHSFGGCVALDLALRAPERVRRLVLVETPLPVTTSDDIDRFLSGPDEKIVGELPRDIRQAVARGGRRGRRFLDSLEFLTQRCTLVEELRREVDIPDAELTRLRVPALAIYGRGSRCRIVGRRLARVVPGLQHVELDGGHNIAFENPSTVAAAVETFLCTRPDAADGKTRRPETGERA